MTYHQSKQSDRLLTHVDRRDLTPNSFLDKDDLKHPNKLVFTQLRSIRTADRQLAHSPTRSCQPLGPLL